MIKIRESTCASSAFCASFSIVQRALLCRVQCIYEQDQGGAEVLLRIDTHRTGIAYNEVISNYRQYRSTYSNASRQRISVA
ncbi:MAG: hypothetical protein F4Y39_08470 [Gemmatimonadetes bacterium]|nr:hypothetical protein [Gemmatimonadota bacterium]MYK52150.1 hypothetical protein [Gemmatimonadota bacterium]